ncbi:MAG: glycosyltransferase [Acidimicrobiales bacterium]
MSDSVVAPATRHRVAGIAVRDVTVVVPTRNEAANVGRFLTSLPTDVALVVVDASDDDTPDLIERIRPSATVLRERAHIAEARQIGADAATTPWVVCTDIDVAFAPDYFDVLAAHPVGPHDGVVCGAKLSTGDHAAYYRLFTRGSALLTQLGLPAASGSNMVVRTEALADAGGFDLELRCNEDSEVVWRIRGGGWTVGYLEALAVHAFDHRRLERGRVRKTLHSLFRCGLLYSGLMNERVRRSDWGYWS